MSNKEILQQNNSRLNTNNIDLTFILHTINNLPENVEIKLQEKTITPTTTQQEIVSDEGYTGLSKVTVKPIPNNYIIPTGTKEINQNGTHDVTEVKSVNVNVKAKAEMITEKDVNFYTPYGELVASYTIEEANNLTELPEAPELPRLTFQEWNYDLADVQATTTPLDIGGTYTTTSGACEFDVNVNSQSGMTVTFSSLRNMTSVDWGDGTVDTNLTHTYTTAGKYTIITYGLTHLANYFLTGNSSTWNNNLVEVRLSTSIMIMTSEAFQRCQALRYITLPNSVTINNSTSQFYYAYALEFYVFPKNSTAINASYMFAYCYNLKGISMPIGLTSFNTYVFQKCYSLKRVVFSKNAKSIYNYMLSDCFGLKKLILGNITSMSNVFGNNYSLEEIDLTNCTSVPTLSGTYLNSINKTCKIKVPANLYESFKTASNWSTYKDYFVAI